MKKLARKKLFYLLLVWGSLIISAVTLFLLYQFEVNDFIITIVFVVILVYMFYIVFSSKSKISFYDMNYRYAVLLDQQKGLEQTNCEFDQSWLQYVVSLKFQLYVETKNLTIYFRISPSLRKKSIQKTSMLEIIAVIKNNDVDFYAEQIEKHYKAIWETYQKEHRLNKQVIIQFKKYHQFNDDIKQKLDQIICYKEADNYLVTINCGYIEEANSIYYLHADRYAPNQYYQYGVELVKTLTK